ncbi:hypothetical protein NUU61_000970 [Penicillium alfredii]|uniref:Copper-fist domain-containing protein n=1 Tax=Penicillium alfredii TaxID=1506179 RepID=A0A9W9GAK6_9EURO|nr:uncharacterized protein NUU61_000970 [Penicillium alfredii]KAJ5115211.1 hypothetical protein NUU61_000970 [Penicillium alfredii]
MLIDGHKCACEACIRGHRVTSCKHYDRPLIRIKRKGRPFATCSICHSTPCESPTEHARQKREAELKCPSKVTQPQPNGRKNSHARLYPRQHNPHGFLPIAPRPVGEKAEQSLIAPPRPLRSASVSGSASSARFPAERDIASHNDICGVGDCSRSESSERDWNSWPHLLSASDVSACDISAAGSTCSAGPAQSLSNSAPGSFSQSILTGALFDPAYSLVSAGSSTSDARIAQTLPSVSPLDSANPFDIPLDPALALDDGSLGYLEDMEIDLGEGMMEETFHVEDWSRYIWSPETGLESLDTGVQAESR